MSEDLRDLMVDICHRLAARGYTPATDGNVSVRLPDGTFLATRTSVSKGMVGRDDLVVVDAKGASLTPGRSPSTEIGMHLFIYARRPDVGAVVHAHPPYATGFAVAREGLTGCILPEVIVGLGAVPLADYATPSTQDVAQSLAPFIDSSQAVLLANHGVVTYGPNLNDAYFKMEKVEHAAQVTFIARLLGGEQRLTHTELEKLRTVSGAAYAKELPAEPCAPAPGEPEADIRTIVREMLNAASRGR